MCWVSTSANVTGPRRSVEVINQLYYLAGWSSAHGLGAELVGASGPAEPCHASRAAGARHRRDKLCRTGQQQVRDDREHRDEDGAGDQFAVVVDLAVDDEPAQP